MKLYISLIVVLLLVLGSVEATRAIWKPYSTNDAIYSKLDNLSKKYPSYVYKERIGYTIQGRSIYMWHIGNKSSPATFMFDGRLHGTEDCGTETGLKFVEWALTSNSYESKKVLSSNHLMFIPIINMDRPNDRQNYRRSYNISGKIIKVPYGVDLNRNFVSGWGASGSSNPSNTYEYRGYSAGSEPETKAVRYAMNKYKPKAYMNVHCGMETLRAAYKDTNAQNYKWAQRQMSAIKTVEKSTGAATSSYYKPYYQSNCGIGGYAQKDGCSFGGVGWLFEISTWPNMPDTLSQYHNKWWKQAFPVYLGISKGVR